MAATDRNVLRLGAYEIFHGDTPPRVAIDEAVELAKRFGSAQSAQFVNGILDKLMRQSDEGGRMKEEGGGAKGDGGRLRNRKRSPCRFQLLSFILHPFSHSIPFPFIRPLTSEFSPWDCSTN